MQKDDEMLYEVWEHFKDLLHLFPHHGLQMQAFYNGVTQCVRSIVDTATRGTLMGKIEDEAYNLIEEVALNNFQWSTERGQPKRVGRKLKVDALTLLSVKIHAVTQRLDQMNVTAVNSSAPFPCEICGSVLLLSI